MRVHVIAVPGSCFSAMVGETAHDQLDSGCSVRNEDQIKVLWIGLEECESLSPC